MFDALNMKLEEAIASAEADIRNNPLNVRRRERAEKLLEAHKQQQSEVIS
jgi:hypothetical protein